ncbi:MAG: cupin domain-containing protein [Gammaproteobacteria bacterium]
MNKKANYHKSTTSTNTYEPFMVGDKQAGEVHWLTQTNSSEQPTYSGLWRCEPMTFEYEFPGDEIFQVLQGKLLVETSDGDKVNLQEGDLISFDKGIKSTWTIQSSFKKFFVISNC